MLLILDRLKILNDFEFVEEIIGDHSGTLIDMGAAYESRRHIRTNPLL